MTMLYNQKLVDGTRRLLAAQRVRRFPQQHLLAIIFQRTGIPFSESTSIARFGPAKFKVKSQSPDEFVRFSSNPDGMSE
jgi:hypothetical protein